MLSPLVFALVLPVLVPSRPVKAPVTISRAAATLTRTAPSTSVSPRGAVLWVNPGNSAASALRRVPTLSPTAALIAKIARQPQSTWIGEWLTPAAATDYVQARVRAANSTGTVPTFVLYAIPSRDCGSYSAGGAGDARTYRSWVDGVSAGLAGGRAVVVAEPDAIASMGCLSPQAQLERLDLLRYAVGSLTRNSRVSVYLDGGNARWQPASTMAARLRLAGIGQARGFVVNAGNFDATQDEIAYGRQIGRELGAAVPFVVDTSRNGLGPFPGADGWCNPPGRALGQRPTTSHPDPLVDALLWVKTPGLSDGTCRGGPPAGTWWESYAVGLASRAAW